MKWLKFFVLVSYCVLLYMVAYVFPHEKAVPTHNQVQFLSIGSIAVVVIAFILIVIWERRGERGRTGGSYKRSKKEALD